MISFEEAEDIMEEVAQELPQAFYQNLNGGILFLPDEKMHPKAVDGDLYILGEYNHGGSMGRYISIYYGSFQRLYGYMNKRQLKQRLKKTLLHEFTHHLESLAGERGLEIKDEIQITDYKNRKNKGNTAQF